MALLLTPEEESVRKVFDVPIEPTREFAERMDAADPLSRFRSEFEIPPSVDGNRLESIYLCGNSLGCLPKRARRYCVEEFCAWRKYGVEAHFRGKRPWATIDEAPTVLMQRIVGAASASEICIMNSLSVNNNLLLISFFRPSKARFKILIEAQAFCSDHHTVRSQLALHGLRAADALIEVAPAPNAHRIGTADIIAAIEAHKHSLSVVWLGAVQYFTGALFDIAAITAAAHRFGVLVGLDLAHGVGNVPLRLHEWGVDFASWCAYKYLNAGPGAIAGVFVHEKHHRSEELLKLKGWWGQPLKHRFAMSAEHSASEGAGAWAMSNPAVLPTVCLHASLEIFHEAGTQNLRHKSVALTAFLEALLNDVDGLEIITPKQKERRGAQLSLIFDKDIGDVHRRITKKGVICDLRKGRVMRVAPTPLYNTFMDVWNFVAILKESLLQSAAAPAVSKL